MKLETKQLIQKKLREFQYQYNTLNNIISDNLCLAAGSMYTEGLTALLLGIQPCLDYDNNNNTCYLMRDKPLSMKVDVHDSEINLTSSNLSISPKDTEETWLERNGDSLSQNDLTKKLIDIVDKQTITFIKSVAQVENVSTIPNTSSAILNINLMTKIQQRIQHSTKELKDVRTSIIVHKSFKDEFLNSLPSNSITIINDTLKGSSQSVACIADKFFVYETDLIDENEVLVGFKDVSNEINCGAAITTNRGVISNNTKLATSNAIFSDADSKNYYFIFRRV